MTSEQLKQAQTVSDNTVGINPSTTMSEWYSKLWDRKYRLQKQITEIEEALKVLDNNPNLKDLAFVLDQVKGA